MPSPESNPNVPAPPQASDLVWPAPVSDSEILWLDPEPAGSSQPTPGTAIAPEVPPSETSLPLSRLIAPGLSMEWHDAVAVVSQLADDLVPKGGAAPAGALPSIDAICLEPDAHVRAVLVPNGSESIVAGFGRVLQALLQDKPTPANLRLLAWRAMSGTGTALALDEFLAEASRWERPGRPAKLKELYERARKIAPPPVAAAAPPAAIEPPAEPQTTVPPPAPAAAKKIALRGTPGVALVLGGAVACMIVGAFTAWLVVRPHDAAPAPPAKATQTESAVDHASDASSSSSGEPRATRGEAANSKTIRQRVQRLVSSVRANTQAASASVEALSIAREPLRGPRGNGLPIARPQPPNAVASSSAPPAAPAAPSVDLARIYRAGDDGVIDAQLVKPYLPPKPPPATPESALSVLEVVVNEYGRVESVHLSNPTNRYRDKWWLFNAKSWIFEPARKDGVPVKFLKRIPLTDLNLAEPQ
jgi:hypothetical protein